MEIFCLICFSFLFYGSIVDLQCCVSFRGIANDSAIHIYILFFRFFSLISGYRVLSMILCVTQ